MKRRTVFVIALAVAVIHIACTNPDAGAAVSSRRMTPVVEAITKIEKSLVNIRTEKLQRRSVSPFAGDPFFEDFFGFNRTVKTEALGSGFIVDTGGTIITNYHVVEQATKIYVILTDNSQYEAEYIGGDKLLDIAVLRVKAGRGFPAAQLASEDDLLLGETVIAIGNPYGLNSSVTTGVVSAKRRVLKLDGGHAQFIQSDALINPGNSGGPLINLDGKVIGINSAIFRQAQGIGFAIPIGVAQRVLPEILTHGRIRPGNPGFTVEQQGSREEPVLIVTGVDPDSDAADLGVRIGDEIITIDGVPVASQKAMTSILRSYPPGSGVEVILARDDRTYKGTMRMAAYPGGYGRSLLEREYGITVADDGDYILVTASNIPRYVRENDVLIAVNNVELNSTKDVDDILFEASGDIILTLFRDGSVLTIRLNR